MLSKHLLQQNLQCFLQSPSCASWWVVFPSVHFPSTLKVAVPWTQSIDRLINSLLHTFSPSFLHRVHFFSFSASRDYSKISLCFFSLGEYRPTRVGHRFFFGRVTGLLFSYSKCYVNAIVLTWIFLFLCLLSSPASTVWTRESRTTFLAL